MKRLKGILLIFVLLCAGCSVEKTGKQLLDSSMRIEASSAKITGATCKAARSELQNAFVTQSSREGAMERLFSSSVRPIGKLEFAASVIRSLPFQKWDGLCGDSEESLQSDYVSSIRQLFGQIHDRIPHSHSVETSTWDPLADSNWNALGALGAALDELDPAFVKVREDRGETPHSLYELFISGLQMEDAYNRGEAVPDYAIEVLKWKPEVLHLLQLRHNFLAEMILVLATDVQDSWFSEGQLLFYKRSVPLVDPVYSSAARLGTYHDWARRIARTRADLRGMDDKIQINKRIGRAIVNIEWTPSLDVTGVDLSRMQNDFIQTYSEIAAENVEVLGLREAPPIESTSDLPETPWLGEGFRDSPL